MEFKLWRPCFFRSSALVICMQHNFRSSHQVHHPAWPWQLGGSYEVYSVSSESSYCWATKIENGIVILHCTPVYIPASLHFHRSSNMRGFVHTKTSKPLGFM